MFASLFLPKNGTPPFQAVLYFPGVGARRLPSSADPDGLVGFRQLDYLVKTGRAVLYPVYEDTYERRRPAGKRFTEIDERNIAIHWAIEVERSLDYLQARPDIDGGKLALMGFSMGTGAVLRSSIYPQRVKACIILSGGLPFSSPPPEIDGINFAPRLKVPTLIVDGQYDYTYPVETSQKPLFHFLGAADRDKKLVLLPYAHWSIDVKDLAREVLDWLDRYLGPVRQT
jgi:dienelactone hydrolase